MSIAYGSYDIIFPPNDYKAIPDSDPRAGFIRESKPEIIGYIVSLLLFTNSLALSYIPLPIFFKFYIQSSNKIRISAS